MDSTEVDTQMGFESEEEDSDMSDEEVSVYIWATLASS